MTRRQAMISAAPARCSSGFTLLEMMVVVLLIGLSVTIVSLSLERDIDKVAELEARRFAALIEHVRDESILSGKTYAVEVDEVTHSYRFLEPGDRWTPVSGDDVLRERFVPEYLGLRLDLLGATATGTKGYLLIHGLSEISPFALTVTGDDFDYVVTVDSALNLFVRQREHEPG